MERKIPGDIFKEILEMIVKKKKTFPWGNILNHIQVSEIFHQNADSLIRHP